MFDNVLPTITTLFASDEKHRAPVKFSWRLVQRKRRPFLLLPDAAENIRFSLELYSAQRPLARLWRSLLPVMFRTPARALLGAVNAEAEASSALLQFFAEQSGQSASDLPTPAIKFGGIAGKTSRVVVLLCDAAGRPIRVVKIGLNLEGRAATEREADILAQLPKATIGCTTLTGQIKTNSLSAFATAYFPGQSLTNDVGIEKLFHAWLLADVAVPLEELPNWKELDAAAIQNEPHVWAALRAALAGKKVCPTLYHGDFTPWNVRMTNLENIQAFDWERGQLQGIPAWDWFHFIVQTAILVKRHSPERVAAELDHFIQSARFQKYAQTAGISDLVEPLLLAYLLHEKYVVQPEEGRQVTEQLFELLWQQWQWKHTPPVVALPVGKPLSGNPILPVAQPVGVMGEIKYAFTNLANLFWEPSLSPQSRPPFAAQFKKHWLAMMLSLAWIFGVANLPLLTDPHLMFSPFYLVPIIIMALKTDRRLATLVAQFSVVFGSMYFYCFNPHFASFKVICWNTAMRMAIFQIIVTLFDRIGQQSVLRSSQQLPTTQKTPIAGNWPVIAVTVLFFISVAVFDVLTTPNMLMLPFYLTPCMILTLALNWRWGAAAAVLAALIGPALQRPDPGYQPWDIQLWNTAMRLILYLLVVVLLEGVRRKNILFSARRRS